MIIKCKLCGIEKDKRKGSKFCSYKCRYTWNNKLKLKKEEAEVIEETLKDKFGNIVYRCRNDKCNGISRKTKGFCSPTCQKQYKDKIRGCKSIISLARIEIHGTC